MVIGYFIRDSIKQWFNGPFSYWLWLAILGILIGYGGFNYWQQLTLGLVVTNMSNQVSWGLYIANFTFFVGIAAAAVMLAIPAYIFDRKDIKDVVLMGDTVAVVAVLMAMLFVVVDLGRPDRIWHMIPGIGVFNFPQSLLSWDVIVLAGYMILNIGISGYILFSYYQNKNPKLRYYFPFVIIAIIWAISVHTVTAFLYVACTGRPFWHNPLLAPRFIASAFASGPAVMILGFQILRGICRYPIHQSVIEHLALVMTYALQITLFFIGVELFTEFYHEGEEALSARYLFFGLDGQHNALVPWIWSAIGLLVTATIIGSIHKLRNNSWLLYMACLFTIVGVWIEKGMGVVIPAFIPTPIGEILEYMPSMLEIAISIGILGIGLLVFTLLAKVVIAIECNTLRYQNVV
ncbi:polysulfide reductase [Achromatium sp. WMS3]|nr:polysulfide reductase [Achromatium sp. WMS3]